MKIVVIARLSSMPVYKQDDYLIMSLIKGGIDIWVVTNSLFHKEKYMQAGARVTLHHPKSKFSLSSIRLIRKILEEQQSDILYLLHSKAVATGAMAAIGLPVKVIAYRGAAGVYWHDPTAYLAHFHPRIDIVCCLSEYIRREMMENDLFKNRQYRVVHKGISETWFKEKNNIQLEAYNIPPAEITIACVANLRKIKGLHYLLQALKEIGDSFSFRALIIGDKTDEPEFREDIAQAGVEDKVFGLGFKENIYDWIRTCDIYVQPSLSEGLGKSIMEAMMLAKPVIATQSGGPEELIVNGSSGLIVPPKNAQALTQAIEYLIRHPEKRKEMGDNAKHRILTDFSIEAFADNMHNIFTEAVK